MVFNSVDRGDAQKQWLQADLKEAEGAAGPLDVRLVAYDSATPSPRVEYRIDDGPWKHALQSGLLSWSARERLSPGSHSLTARCDVGDGVPVEKLVSFNAVSGKAPVPVPGEDWPMLRHDAERSGVTGGIITAPLRLAWTTCLGGSAHGAAPVVVGDTLYMGIADEDCGGSGSVYALSVAGEVIALDAATGKVRFEYMVNGVNRWLFSSPVVADGVLYVGSGAEFLALDAKTGARMRYRGTRCMSPRSTEWCARS